MERSGTSRGLLLSAAGLCCLIWLLTGSPAGAGTFVPVPGTRWGWDGEEKLKIKGYGSDAFYPIGDVMFIDSNSFIINEDGFSWGGDSTYTQEGSKIQFNVGNEDIERIAENRAAKAGYNIILEQLRSFSLKVKVKSKGPMLKGKMKFKAYVAVPDHGLSNVKISLKGKYYGYQFPAGQLSRVMGDTGLLPIGESAGFLLAGETRPLVVEPVPEPGTLALFGLGCLGLLIRRFRR